MASAARAGRARKGGSREEGGEGAFASSHAARALAAASEELRWEGEEAREIDAEADSDAEAEAEAERRALAEIRAARGAGQAAAAAAGEDAAAEGQQAAEQEEQRLVYDVEGIHDKLEEFAWTGTEAWVESHVLEGDAPPQEVDVHDDLKRELVFYAQALAAAKEGIRRYHKQGLPFQRPNDFFAEMVKDDAHMKKVKDKLLHEKRVSEESEANRKQRVAKKYQKHVAAERVKERSANRKQEMESIKRWRKNRQRSGFADAKGGQEELERLLAAGPTRKLNERGNARLRPDGPKSRARAGRDAKFGFGGRKGLKKQNDQDSYMAATPGFRGHEKHAAPGARGGAGKRQQGKRPGKSRRQANKTKHGQ